MRIIYIYIYKKDKTTPTNPACSIKKTHTHTHTHTHTGVQWWISVQQEHPYLSLHHYARFFGEGVATQQQQLSDVSVRRCPGPGSELLFLNFLTAPSSSSSSSSSSSPSSGSSGSSSLSLSLCVCVCVSLSLPPPITSPLLDSEASDERCWPVGRRAGDGARARIGEASFGGREQGRRRRFLLPGSRLK